MTAEQLEEAIGALVQQARDAGLPADDIISALEVQLYAARELAEGDEHDGA